MSTKAQAKIDEVKAYWRKLATLSVVLVLLISALVVLDRFGSNRLLEFDFRRSGGDAVAYDQLFSFDFSRPLQPEIRQKLPELIEFSPAIAGNFRILENKVIFSPTEVLRYGQKYKVTVAKDLLDSFNQPLSQAYEFEFKVKPLQFLYQQRAGDTGSNLNLATLTAEGDIETTTILNNRELREFGADYLGEYFAYTLQPDDVGPTNLFVYDLATRQNVPVNLPSAIAISSLSFDKRGNLYFMGGLTTAEVADLPDNSSDIILAKPYRYNLDNARLEELNVLGPLYPELLSFLITADGNSAVVQKQTYDYMVVSLIDGEAKPLGKFNTFGGLDYRGEKFAGLEIDLSLSELMPIAKVISAEGELYSTGARDYSRDPKINSAGNELAYSYQQKESEGSEGIFGLKLIDINAKTEILRLDEEGWSLELPSYSPDNAFLSAESIAEQVLDSIQRPVRLYNNAGRPSTAKLEIYRRLDQSLVKYKTLENGFNLTWLN